jgi:hypothetical protein
MNDFPKERAMSTFIQRKSPMATEKEDLLRKRSASRGLVLPPTDKNIGNDADISLENVT